MHQFKIFIQLTRLDKPIGFMLLFWPCSWGLAYAFSINQDYYLFLNYLALFFLGSVLMRSAGCIVNDIVDRDFDKKVNRTKARPIAAGKITIQRSILYVLILCLLAFLILIQFNAFTIILGMSSMLLAFSYPFMKRITYWPQFFLGITFNWGIIMASAAILDTIPTEILILYTSAIFWTLGYDTIYGAQDMSDDEIIGLKSTSIKFKNNLKFFVFISYLIVIVLLLYNFKESLNLIFFTIFLSLFCLSLLTQVMMLNKKNSKNYLQLFKSNNISGALLFFAFLFKSMNL
tara:strand:+ start:240 stop:1106 length:867 start_codon:yes stop_codon:yes gene_type:complete